jgi:hypothetical protein
MPDMDLRGFEFCLEAGPREAPITLDTIDMTVWRRQMLLYSYMLWPTDAARRQALAAGLWHQVRVGWGREWLDQELAAWIGSSSVADSAGPPLEPRENARLRAAILAHVHDLIGNCFEESFKIEGGFDTDPIARSDIHSQCRAACRAGQTLGMLQAISARPAIRGRGTMHKAVHVMEKAGIGKRSKTYQAWASHKRVAHLAVAFITIDQLRDAGQLAGNIEVEVNAILAIARQFQEFAVADGHIGADEMWTVPAVLELPPCEPVGFQMTEAMLDTLRGYRAPQ